MQSSVELLVERIAELERAAEACAYLRDQIGEIVPASDYWQAEVCYARRWLARMLELLGAELRRLGYE
jgi:hypothetical protein